MLTHPGKQPFSIGQRVKCIRGNIHTHPFQNKEYTISTCLFRDTQWMVDITSDSGEQPGKDSESPGAWFANRFEAVISGAVPLINNHVCPSCKNDRLNKSEKSCWKCGAKL